MLSSRFQVSFWIDCQPLGNLKTYLSFTFNGPKTRDQLKIATSHKYGGNTWYGTRANWRVTTILVSHARIIPPTGSTTKILQEWLLQLTELRSRRSCWHQVLLLWPPVSRRTTRSSKAEVSSSGELRPVKTVRQDSSSYQPKHVRIPHQIQRWQRPSPQNIEPGQNQGALLNSESPIYFLPV